MTSHDDFFENWATIRGDLAATLPESFDALGARARSLDDLADSSRKRALAAATQVKVGAQIGDEQLLNQAFNRVAALSGDELREALETVSDLTCLGMPSDRWRVVRRAVGHVGDPAVEFIEEKSLQRAQDLVDSGWSPDETLMPELRSELRLQVGWVAVELLLATADERAKRLALMRVLRFRDGVEPGWWERSLQMVAVSLIAGEVDEGIRRVETLRLKTPPAWAGQRIRLEIVRLAPLAAARAGDWIQLCPEGLPKRQHAPSTSLAASTVLAGVLQCPGTSTPAKLSPFIADLRLMPWALFGAFIVGKLRASLRDYLAEQLIELSDEEWRMLPWCGRRTGFAEACGACGDVRVAIELLLRARAVDDGPELVDAIALIIERSGPEKLAVLDLPRIAAAYAGDLDRFSTQTAAVLARGGVVRAVVDGSNVMWGGRGRSEGAKPKMTYLKDVVTQLRAGGYSDVGVFVDAQTRHDLSPADAQELERWKARNEATEVRGQADPAIIRYFLEHPEGTEIVSGDDFREWRQSSEFSDLNRWWPQCRRSFYVAPDDQIRWNVPLNRTAR